MRSVSQQTKISHTLSGLCKPILLATELWGNSGEKIMTLQKFANIA